MACRPHQNHDGAAKPSRYIGRPGDPRGRLPHRIPAQFGKASGTRAAHRWAMALFEWRWRKPKPTERRESEVTTGADVAQLVEQLTRNEQVVRSNRIVGSI